MTGRGWAAGLARPHRWSCKHCGMVEDYRLTRQAQLEYTEGPHGRGEDYRLITFKDWLRAYQWEQPPERHAVTVPQPRPSGSAIETARRAVAALDVDDETATWRTPADTVSDAEGRCRV